MKVYRIVLFLLLTIGIIVLGILVWNKKKFPPIGATCFNEFVQDMNNGFADPDLNLPQFDLKEKNFSRFRCASQTGFSQYEIEGITTDKAHVYIHRSAGGMAASGADGYFDYCYIKNGEVVISERFIGRSDQKTQSVCKWEENFPDQPISRYRFKSKS